MVTMAPKQLGSIGLRTLRTTGALLAALALSSCGQINGAMTHGPPAAQPAPPPSAADQTMTQAGSEPEPSSRATTTTSTESSTEPKESKSNERCHTSMLAGSLQRGDVGAGQRYAELVLQNTSATSCTLYGYGGLQLIGENGQPLPTNLERVPNPGPQMLMLEPGDSAASTLHWRVVGDDSEPTNGPCQPTPASAQVIPPDETDPLTVDWTMAGPVCQHGRISGTAYH